MIFNDEIFMARALELAEEGAGWVDPNPMVGCVVVSSDGDIIGEGWHKGFGGLHAEREALADCSARGNSPVGASVYVTLEPCCHWGKTPPCTDALIAADVARVVVGCLDANPLVASAGCAELEKAGIDVKIGVLEEQCRALNKVFFHYIKTGKPYIIAKYAITLDGRIASRSGRSQWITGEIAREHVHASRSRYAAVMVGIGTVLADDPTLNCRLDGHRHQPTRIVCDAGLRTPLDSNLVRTARDIPLIIAVSDGISPDRLTLYADRGCKVIQVSSHDGRLDLQQLVSELGRMGLDSLYVEGGPALLGSLLDAKLVDHVQAYIAPKLLGGAEAPCAIGGLGACSPQGAAIVADPKIEIFGDDMLIEGDLEYN